MKLYTDRNGKLYYFMQKLPEPIFLFWYWKINHKLRQRARRKK